MFYDATKRDHGLAQDPLKSLIVPRPIGWISTVDGQGRVNLAPYSFYNAVSEFPPMVYFAITGRYGDTPTKHSRMNAEETGEFVVNMVAGTLREKMNITTAMVVTTLPAVPARRLIAPSSASMNSSAFLSAASEMPGGSPASTGMSPSAIVPPAAVC